MKNNMVIFSILCIASIYGQIGNVIWEENFDNLDNWVIETGNGSWGWGNGELQYYKSENIDIVEVEGETGNHAVRITAKQESGIGIIDQWGNPLNYTSGKITSKSKISVQYGMIETRALVPDIDLGGWPAVWMLGTANYNWPRCGELDMMEMGHTQAFRDLHDEHNGGNGNNNSTVNQMVGANAIFYADEAVNEGNPSGGIGAGIIGLSLLIDLFSRSFGMMLIGMACFSWGVFSNVLNKSFYEKLIIYGLGIGLPLSMIGLFFTYSFNRNIYIIFISNIVVYIIMFH